MSGPDINRPKPGDNAIGRFVIGVSPIGSIAPVFDFWETVISQYANSPSLIGLIQGFSDCVDPTSNIDAFFDLVFNVDTAQGYGLDVWGRIVGVSRTLHVSNPGTYFGFAEATLGAEPFNQAPFYSGDSLTQNYDLDDDSYRRLILAKALSNISDGSTKAINELMMRVFPNRGNAYVIDDGGMQMRYAFGFVLTPVEAAIAVQSGVFPKPTGVSATVAQLP